MDIRTSVLQDRRWTACLGGQIRLLVNSRLVTSAEIPNKPPIASVAPRTVWPVDRPPGPTGGQHDPEGRWVLGHAAPSTEIIPVGLIPPWRSLTLEAHPCLL